MTSLPIPDFYSARPLGCSESGATYMWLHKSLYEYICLYSDRLKVSKVVYICFYSQLQQNRALQDKNFVATTL
jgi:hypothetical protein